MKPDDKRVYVYLIDSTEPIIINAMGYYMIDSNISEEYYYIILDYDNQETARFNKAYVKGIVRQ